MDIIGRTIANRYEIISKTGVGGMATVYVARDKVLNRDVAVKVLKDEFTTDDEFVKRFNSEAQAAASLTHANIVSIYDVGNEDGITRCKRGCRNRNTDCPGYGSGTQQSYYPQGY